MCSNVRIAFFAFVGIVSFIPALHAGNPRASIYSADSTLLAEIQMDPNAAPRIDQEYVWFGDRPVAQYDGGNLRWTVADHLGAPLVQIGTNADVSWRGEYEPFGSIMLRAGQSLRQPLRCPGQEASGDGDREYNVARWYRAAWGRYTQADPIGLDGGVDEYVYAEDRPTVLTDASGRAPKGPKTQGTPPTTDCGAICQMAEADRELRKGGGGVVCFHGKKCPCVFRSTAKPGQCPDLDAIVLAHEERHISNDDYLNLSCENDGLCRAGVPRGFLLMSECPNRRQTVIELGEALERNPGISRKCNKAMRELADEENKFLSANCTGVLVW